MAIWRGTGWFGLLFGTVVFGVGAFGRAGAAAGTGAGTGDDEEERATFGPADDFIFLDAPCCAAPLGGSFRTALEVDGGVVGSGTTFGVVVEADADDGSSRGFIFAENIFLKLFRANLPICTKWSAFRVEL